MYKMHYMKSVRKQSFSGPYFTLFGLNLETHIEVSQLIYTANQLTGLYMSLRIQSECGKIRTKKTPNTDTFHAV